MEQNPKFGDDLTKRAVFSPEEQARRAALLERMTTALEPHQFQHREAFMLMRYVSEGGTDEKLIWNSRDGVTPFSIVVDGLKYHHDMRMRGPFFDRPEGVVGQWETRTEAKMMEAWHRTLDRAVLAGRMDRAKAQDVANLPDVARSWGLHIGLRSLATGKYTDEA